MKAIILFIFLLFEVKTNKYLSMKLEIVDNCLKSINKEENETLYVNENVPPNCRLSQQYPVPLFQTPYEYKQKIFIEFFDAGYIGNFRMTVNINEYTIKTEHNRFWTCVNCYGENNNYIYNPYENRFEFYKGYTGVPNELYFTFYFQINSPLELEYKNNIVKDSFYAFTSQKYFNFIIDSLEDEINLINFNTTDNFYIKNNPALIVPYEEKGFKIFFDKDSFSGTFIGLNEMKGDIKLNNGDIFKVSQSKGLRYILGDDEKRKKELYLKIKLVAYSSSHASLSKPVSKEQEFHFYICLKWYIFTYNNGKNECYGLEDLFSEISMLFNKNSSEEKDGFLNELIDNVINKTEEDLIMEHNNIKYEITTTNSNNLSNEYKNISIINLGECEKILKKHNNISENESLIILKRDIYKKGVSIPKLEYEVLDINIKKKLDLNVCKDTKIEILIPHSIEENNEKKYNIESDYCNDTCYTYTTEKGPDITLSDRRNECINNIMSICEDNCVFGGYKSNTKKFICKCEIKTNISLSEVLQIRNKY